MVKAYCFKCGNRGLPDGCPDCGRKPSGMDLMAEKPEEKMKKENQYREILIPEHYMNIMWDEDVFWKTNQMGKAEPQLLRFISQLKKIFDIFSSGAIPNKSAFIIAPALHGKNVFAYSCMRLALNNNYTVAPMIDSQDLKRFMVNITTTPNYKLLGTLNWDSYINSDVVFITVVRSNLHYDAYLSIIDLVEKRARLNKPTFIISEFSLEEISRWDGSKHYTALNKATNTDNALRLPIVIEYKGAKYNGNKINR